MNQLSPFAPVSTDEIPDYPEHLLSERLESHSFLTFHFRRWLTSETRLTCEDDVKGHILDLFFIAQDQTPVGTLPTDEKILAKLLGVSLDRWRELSSRSVPPLHNWHRCRCGDVIRLMHPVVMEVALDATKRKRDNAQRAAIRRENKALADLKDRMIKMGSKNMADSQTMLERVNEWLNVHCVGNRTEPRIREAMEAVSCAPR